MIKFVVTFVFEQQWWAVTVQTFSEIANESNPNTSKHTYSSVARNSQGPKTKKKGEQRGQKAAHSGSTTASNVKGNKMHACRSLTSYMLKFPSLLVNLSLSMFLCSGSCLKVQSGLVQPVVLQKKHSFLNGLRQRRETIFYFKIRLEGMNVTHNTNKLI